MDSVDEPLKINQIVLLKMRGDERYYNLELLHKSCHKQHQSLLEKYGGGKDFPKITTYFQNNQVEPNSKDGYELMKKAFKKFKY